MKFNFIIIFLILINNYIIINSHLTKNYNINKNQLNINKEDVIISELKNKECIIISSSDNFIEGNIKDNIWYFNSLQDAIKNCINSKIRCLTEESINSEGLKFENIYFINKFEIHNCNLINVYNWTIPNYNKFNNKNYISNNNKEEEEEEKVSIKTSKYYRRLYNKNINKNEISINYKNNIDHYIKDYSSISNTVYEIIFKNVNFEGLSTTNKLFNIEIENKNITFDNCTIKNYDGEYFLKLGKRSIIKFINNKFINIKGYCIYGYELDYYYINNNKFIKCGCISSDSSIYLKLNYILPNIRKSEFSNNLFNFNSSELDYFNNNNIKDNCIAYKFDGDLRTIIINNEIIGGNIINNGIGFYNQQIENKILSQQLVSNDDKSLLRQYNKNNNINVNKNELILELNKLENIIYNSKYDEYLSINSIYENNNYCNISSINIQNDIDNCEYDFLIFNENNYIIDNLLIIEKNNIKLISFINSNILSSDSIIIKGNNTIIKGFRFIPLYNIDKTKIPIILINNTLINIEIYNNEFIGLDIKIRPLLKFFDLESSINNIIFNFNYIHDFYYNCIILDNYINNGIFKYNIFNHNFGNSIKINNINNLLFESNKFIQCRGLDITSEISIIYINCNIDCKIKRNNHSIINLGSSNINDIGYFLLGNGFKLNNIKGNSCNGLNYGLILKNNDNFSKNSDFNKLLLQNSLIKDSLYNDISIIGREKYIFNKNIEYNNNNNIKECYVSKIYNEFNEEDNFGYIKFNTINQAIKYCPNNYVIITKDELIRENLIINRDVIIMSLNSSIIYGHGHELLANNITFENLHFKYSINNQLIQEYKYNNNINKELFLSNNDYSIKYLKFINVDFIGNHGFINFTDEGIRVDIMDIYLSVNGYIEINNCNIYDWPYLINDAIYNEDINKIVYINKEYNIDNPLLIDPYLTPSGGRIWIKLKKDIDIIGNSKILIINNYFENIDGNAIRIENINSYNISNNIFIDSGGRKIGYESLVIIKGNRLNKGLSYIFENNFSNQTLPVLFPSTGLLSNRYYYTTYWLFDFPDNVSNWYFKNNIAIGHPVGTRISSMSLDIINKSFKNNNNNNSDLERNILSVNSNFDFNYYDEPIIDKNKFILSNLAENGSNCNVNGTIYDIIYCEPGEDINLNKKLLINNKNGPISCSSNKNPIIKGINGSSCKCSIPPPTNCIVNKDDININENNIYYNKWLFTSINKAILKCEHVNKSILIMKSISPYMEDIFLQNYDLQNIKLFSNNGAEIMGSNHLIFINNIILDGINFIHMGNNPTLIINQINSFSNINNSNIIIKNSTFHGSFTKNNAIDSINSYNINFNNIIFNDYRSDNIINIKDNGITYIKYCKFINIFNTAINLNSISGIYNIEYNLFTANSNLEEIINNKTIVYTRSDNPKNIIFKYNHIENYNNISKEIDKNYINNLISNNINKGLKTGFWIDGINSLSNNSTIINSNYINHYVAIGLRITNINPDNESITLKQLSHISNKENNTNIKGLWHDIVKGPLLIDLQKIPFNNNLDQQLICDGGCQTIDFIAIGGILIFVFITISLVCLCVGYGSQDGNTRISTVYSRVLGSYIPKDKKFWPTLQYGHLPGWYRQIRPVPAYLGDKQANNIARKNYYKDLNNDKLQLY
jgi:hypothetical protein